jgi:hypothetical protein
MHFDIVLGGICSISTAESEAIRKKEIAFVGLRGFGDWFAGWYPRIDQVHSTVGVPPRQWGTQEIIYVCEDSFFGRRLAKWTGLEAIELSATLKEAHENQGHKVVERFLRQRGYRGSVRVVYTSDLERELETALRIWERMLGFRFRSKYRDRAKVNLMYTGFWLDVLGITGPALVFEPGTHGIETDSFPELKPWIAQNLYGEGVNRDITVLGYRPFWSALGMTREFPLESVPNRTNWREFVVNESDAPWYAGNFGYREGLSLAEIQRRVRLDLETLYGP